MKALRKSFISVLTDSEVTDTDRTRVFLCLFAIVAIILLLNGLPNVAGNF